MISTKRAKTSLDTPIRILYQCLLLAGCLLLISAVFLILRGTIEAILMALPGLLSLGSGIVFRSISKDKRFAA